MSDRMRPIPFWQLMTRVLTEYKAEKSIFGVRKIYKHSGGALPIFTGGIETPIGPAAGPHTQLAQNIIAAYAGGARFFELKTVQKLDGEDLPVSKPCILALDEGYNVEWSTELTVPDAYNEYVKAWYCIKLISRELGLGSPDGFAFNMSVGYDLDGIKTKKLDDYIEGMKNAAHSAIWRECAAWASANLACFNNLDAAYVDSISPNVCESITISTLHGCPPEEIERIAAYLITEKGVNTYVKCNPTLLGYDFARSTLDSMGYDYLVFDEHHFKDDLQYSDAVPMLKRLVSLAGSRGLEFGVKLTNTFPVTIARGELPGDEMYMSGRSLYPLTIALAAKLSADFDGRLRISYSGGADAFNISEVFGCNIWPITMATTLLNPGGYDRLAQMAELLSGLPYGKFERVDVSKVSALAASAVKNKRHIKPPKITPRPSGDGKAPLLDCFEAGCVNGCPIRQDIPEYLSLVDKGENAAALEVICRKNPLPFITGTICSHRCQSGCVRNFCDDPVAIRDAKLIAAKGGYAEFIKTLKPGEPRKEKAAIIGGGPAGMSAAYFLSRAGASVTLFEKNNALGGAVYEVIPEFRISSEAIAKDAALLERLGVDIRLDTAAPSASELFEKGYTHVLLACGASKHGVLRLEKGASMNALDFLKAAKWSPETLELGENVVITGGGNTAMDAARAAKRVPGVKNVTIVYRRTVRQMPADAAELELAMEEGVEFRPLLLPVSLENGALVCEVMALGEKDASGRSKPVGTGKFETLNADILIAAVGEGVDGEFLASNGAAVDDKGRAKLEAGDRLFVIGDAQRGPATVAEAIADAALACEKILAQKQEQLSFKPENAALDKRGVLEARHDGCDAARCLGCAGVCETCVEVCPNRANIAVKVSGMEMAQVVHIDGPCNECGNCAAFCPHGGRPYKDKFTLFGNAADFESSENEGFLPLPDGAYRLRLNGLCFDCALPDARVPEGLEKLILAVIKDYAYCL